MNPCRNIFIIIHQHLIILISPVGAAVLSYGRWRIAEKNREEQPHAMQALWTSVHLAVCLQ